MAKTGFWLRGAKGKLAGTTLYRGRTGTVQREIVTPTNPKTNGMMLQRALFASVAKFYSNGQKNLFKFAFENKKANQTDFNAFMQANVNQGCYFPKSVVEDNSCPMLGSFTLTRGTLPSVKIHEIDLDEDYQVQAWTDIKLVDNKLATIADVSKHFIAAGHLEGDIVTMLGIASSHSYHPHRPQNGYMSVVNSDVPPVWMVKQFVINSADTRNFAETVGVTPSIFNFYDGEEEMDVIALTFNGLTLAHDNDIAAAAVVVSRNSSGGLKVSTTELKINIYGMRVLLQGSKLSVPQNTSYFKLVADSWGAKSDAVLQGSIANRVEAVVEPPVATSIQGAAATPATTLQCSPSSVGGSTDTDIDVGESKWIRVIGTNLKEITVSDISLSVDASKGTVDEVLAMEDAICIKITAKAAANDVNVRCSKLAAALLCKVSFT